MTAQDLDALPGTDNEELLGLLVGGSETSSRDRLQSLSESGAWKAQLVDKAQSDPRVRECVPLAFYRMQALGIDTAEYPNFRAIRAAYIARAAQQGNTWRRLVEEMQLKGVNPLLLKGAGLSHGYYPEPGLRPMSDIDILISHESKPDADHVLKHLDWLPEVGVIDVGDGEFEHSAQYIQAEKAWSEVDLHVHVLSKCYHPEIDRWFFSRIEWFEFYGLRVRRLAPTAMLAHVLLHGLRYQSSTPIRWVVDASLIISTRGSDIDWEELLLFSRKHSFTHRISMALIYLHKKRFAKVPNNVVDQLKQHKASRYELLETSFLLTPMPVNKTLITRITYLVKLIVWRATRMRGGWFIPIDSWRVFVHMLGAASFKANLRRAWYFNRSN